MASSTSSTPATVSIVTPDDHSAFLTISTYFLMIMFILSVAIRYAIRWGIAKSISLDDWLSCGAMFIGIGQSVCILWGIDHGLGKKPSLLSTQSIIDTEKAQYASDYFYITGLGLAKASILLLVQRLAVSKRHKQMAGATMYLVAVWTVAGLVTLAARCGSALPWTTTSPHTQCINMKTFWIAMAPVDLIVECIIMLIPFLMMIPVQVALSKKAVIVIAFIFRSLVVATTIVRLTFLQPRLTAQNITFQDINAEILTSIVLSVSITTACVPCLKPFLDAFDSGRMAVTVKDGVAGGTHNEGGSRSYPMRDLSYGNNLAYGNQSLGRSRMDQQNDNDDSSGDDIEAMKFGSSVKVAGPGLKADDRTSTHHKRGMHAADPFNEKEESASLGSDKSDQMIIKKNVQWTVQYEDADVAPTSGTARSQSRQYSQINLCDDVSEDYSRQGISPIGLAS